MNIECIERDGASWVTLSTPDVSMEVLTSGGPRIASLCYKGGDNLLLWNPGEYTRGDWDLRGGHRVWLSRPQGDEAEETYTPDNQPAEVSIEGDQVTIKAAVDPVTQTQRAISIRRIDDSTFEVDNRLTNVGEMLFSAGVWALTCTVPSSDCQYYVPLGDGTSWDTCTMVMFKTWAGHGQNTFADSQFAVEDDMLVLSPQGLENKRMVMAPKGIIAWANRQQNVLFAKRVAHDAAGQYPMNTNIAMYVGPENFMVEMETMGAERPLKPGDTAHNVETWSLSSLAKTITPDNLEAVFA